MLLGIVLHAAISFMETKVPWVLQDSQTNLGFDVLVSLIHGFRMQLFFFIAGFFARLLIRRIGVRRFIQHRLVRVGIPFIVGLFTLLPVIFVIWMIGNRVGGIVPSAEMTRTPQSIGEFPTAHLWFLEYLLIFYGAVVLLQLPRVKLDKSGWGRIADRLYSGLLGAWWKPFVLPLLTVPFLMGGPMIGEVESAGVAMMPRWQALIYYGIYFACGWMLHRQKGLLGEFLRFRWLYLATAVVSFAGYAAVLVAIEEGEVANQRAIEMIGHTFAEIYTWAMLFGFTGMFLKYFASRAAWARYLADASYWFYLIHLPLVLWLQIVVAKWEVNALLKFAFINVVTILILLATYDWIVRYTFIGRILNGKRTRPEPNSPALTSSRAG